MSENSSLLVRHDAEQVRFEGLIPLCAVCRHQLADQLTKAAFQTVRVLDYGEGFAVTLVGNFTSEEVQNWTGLIESAMEDCGCHDPT